MMANNYLSAQNSEMVSIENVPAFTVNQIVKSYDFVDYPITIGQQSISEDMLIIYVDYYNDAVFLINVRSTPKSPIRVSYSALMLSLSCLDIEVSHFSWEPRVIRSFDSLSQKEQKKVMERYRIIAPLIEDLEGYLYRRYKSYSISRIASEHGMSRQTVTDYLLAFFYYGKRKNALCLPVGKEIQREKRARCLRVKQGRPNETGVLEGKLLTEMDIQYFKRITKQMECNTGANIRTYVDAYKIMIQSFYYDEKTILDATTSRVRGKRYDLTLLPQTEIPTYRQFTYWIQKTYGHKKIRLKNACLPSSEQQKDFNGRKGNAYANIIAPGQLYEIDETPFDEELISHLSTSDNIIHLGKPTVYIIKDVFTRYIVGFYATLDTPSYDTLRKALFNSCRDRKSWLKSIHCEDFLEEWENMGLPTTILVDNAELNNNKSEGLITDLDVTVSFTRPGRGDDKPFVESTFNSLTAFLPSLSKGHKRAGKLAQRRNDARGQAVFTLDDLNFLLMEYCCYANNHKVHNGINLDLEMVKAGISKIPNQMLKWGLKNRPGYMRHIEEKELTMKLLPRGEVSVRQKGVYLKDIRLLYTSPDILSSGLQDRSSVGSNKSNTFPCRYDPSNLDRIYVEVDGNSHVCELDENLRLFEGKSMKEIKLIKNHLKKVNLIDELNSRKEESSVAATTKGVVDRAKQAFDQRRRGTADISDIRKNRQVEQKVLDGYGSNGTEDSLAVQENSINTTKTNSETDQPYNDEWENS